MPLHRSPPLNVVTLDLSVWKGKDILIRRTQGSGGERLRSQLSSVEGSVLGAMRTDECCPTHRCRPQTSAVVTTWKNTRHKGTKQTQWTEAWFVVIISRLLGWAHEIHLSALHLTHEGDLTSY